jgi:hypothetical protein
LVVSLIYSLIRVIFDVLATNHRDQAAMQAEVLALRRQVQVLERQVKRVHWAPSDRMILAALRRLPIAAWPGLLVRPDRLAWLVGATVRRARLGGLLN